jgi:hypothetical protein
VNVRRMRSDRLIKIDVVDNSILLKTKRREMRSQRKM